MKNIINFIRLFLKKFDKFVIVPTTKFFLWTTDKINKNTRGFEKIFARRSSLIFISLTLALLLFFVVDTKSITLLETSADVIYNQNVNVIYNEEAYVIEGIPDAVDITLIGRKADLYLAKQLPTHEVSIDLKELKPGTHRVSLKYKGSINTINYKLDPSIASVTIYPKVSEVRTITTDILNSDKLNSKLVIDSVEIDRREVIIKGASYKLNQVASIKALVDINNLNNPDVGVMDLNEISLKAYDEKGNIVDIEIVPSKVSAKVTITSPNKTVPIKIVPTGQMAFGQALKSINSNVDSVTIYGEKSVIDQISFVPVELDIDKLSSSKSATVTIKKPSGVRYISKTSATVNVEVGKEVTKEISGVKINIINLPDKYKALASSKEDSEIVVVLKGVEEVLNSIDATSIKAIVDLSSYGAGNHDVEVKVEGNDVKVIYVPKVKTVNLTIENKN